MHGKVQFRLVQSSRLEGFYFCQRNPCPRQNKTRGQENGMLMSSDEADSNVHSIRKRVPGTTFPNVRSGVHLGLHTRVDRRRSSVGFI